MEKRRAVLEDLARVPGVLARVDGDGISLELSQEWEGPDTRFLELVRRLAGTYYSPRARLIRPDSEDRVTRGIAALLAGFDIVPLGNIRFEYGDVRSLRLTASPLLTGEPPAGVHLESLHSVPPPDDKHPLAFHISCLETDGLRSWFLNVRDGAGKTVRRFTGKEASFLTVYWDGKDGNRRPVAPGVYEAVLTASSRGGRNGQDRIRVAIRPPSFIVYDPPPAAPGRKWFRLIRFMESRSTLSGAMKLAVEQIAQTLKIYPDRRISVEGYADSREFSPERLALGRAEAVVALLTNRFGVRPEQVELKGHAPQRAPPGEFLQKAVVYFIE
ncbi:MAG: OmpA family protein [Elusimicrobiota bacterium]